MAKAQTYGEDLLVTAVIRYAEEHDGKIQLSALAKWARANIPGLEDVKYYHFTRPIQIKDPLTGIITEREKTCKKRLDEINKARSITYAVKTNTLLQSANIDDFMKLPIQVQRKVILDTRSQVDTLIKKNLSLSKTNKELEKENERLLNENQLHEANFKELKEKQDLLSRQVSSLSRKYNERAMRSALAEMGVTDNGYDLRRYTESLTEGVNDAFSIRSAIKEKISPDSDEGFFENIMEGMDF